ncbi:cytochrome P450 [Streptomyces sp. BpilaLS-43]|uniref:cytochrome P450 n=1 Tax=Streptomyces sp. BpilaLS-43 TaxID=1839778 RepID=UPI00210B602E|nr:cytochrome P450 [Streptomyces sp. BpilaLS-43]
MTPRSEAEADRVVERLVGRGRFEVVTELAEYLPMTVVSDLVGLPDHGREKMLEWAEAIWNTQGPADDRAAAAGPAVEEFMAFAVHDAVPGKIDPDGWAAQLYEAADRGEIPHAKCSAMMLDYVTPSLDTTILAITNAVALSAENPDQWDLLRADRSLIPHAINESLRLETPAPQFGRVLTEDHETGGVRLAAGSRVALLHASANRDERHYPDPARFDITRRPSDHLAFGRGEHVCVGMHLARPEMSALLARLADRVAGFGVLGRRPLINNGSRGLDRLEVAIRPAT